MQFQKKSFTNTLPARKHGGIIGYIIFLIAGILVIGGFYYMSTLKGSRAGTDEYLQDTTDPIEAEKCLRDSESLETHFNSIHEVKKEKISSEDINIYEKATTQYRKYLEYAGMDSRINPRYDKMRRKLHNLRADSLRAKTILIEGNAEKLAREGKYSDAEKLFETAYKIEEQINAQFALSDKTDSARTIALRDRMLAMHAAPMKIEAEKAEKIGIEALRNRNWAKANIEFGKAHKISQTLWNDFREVITVDTINLNKISAMLATAQSASQYEEIERNKVTAQEAESKKEWAKAIEIWQKIAKAQSILVADFPLSEFAAEARTKEITVALANAEARTSFIELTQTLADLQREIRSQKTRRIPILARQTSAIASKINNTWRDNTLVPAELINNLAYIDMKSQDIAQIQEIFFGGILPIPGIVDTTKLMKTEVSQALYTYVLGTNPSADSREQLAPVESVSYQDALTFCSRLSTLVGYEIRLPSKKEFETALGNTNEKDLPQIAWMLENSGGTIHRVATKEANANGFHDLLGNVAEWLLPTPDLKKNEAIIAGGDCQSQESRILADQLYKPGLRTEKSRLRGFRAIIDFSKPLNLASPQESK